MNNPMAAIQAQIDHQRGVEDARTTEEKLAVIRNKLDFYAQIMTLTYVLAKYNEDGKHVDNEEIDPEEFGIKLSEEEIGEEEPEVTLDSDMDATLNCDSDYFRLLYKLIGDKIEYQIICQVDQDNLLIHEACPQHEKPAFIEEILTMMRKLGDGKLKEIGERAYLHK